MADWTLENNGVTQALAAWGIGADIRRVRGNQTVDWCTFSVPGPVDAEWLFDYGSEVIIRDAAAAVWFRGYMAGVEMSARDKQRVVYQIAGPWWWLERIVYQQEWKSYNAADPENPLTRLASEVFLGQAVDGTRLHAGQQISAALAWANACFLAEKGVNLVTAGTIDTTAQVPIYNARDITVAEVITQMLRWTGDTAWIDYSTSPPTFYARKLANLTAKTVAVGDEVIRELALRPRHDIVLPSVCLKYKQITEVNGQSWLDPTEDIYPLTATGTEVGGSVHTVELAGLKLTNTSATLRCEAIGAGAGTNGGRVAWWQKKVPWLKSANIDAATLTISAPTKIEDDSDATVSLATYPNELLDGQIADWMGKNTKTIKIYAVASYTQYKDGEKKIKTHAPVSAPIHVTVHATDASSGTFTALESFDPGEAVPVGLAQAIYDGRKDLQYEGQVSLVGSAIPTGLGVGCKLTITGLDLTLASQLIQEVVDEPFFTRSTLKIGPATQLGVADLIELLRVNRYRLVYNAPSSRSTGKSGGDGKVTLGDKTAKENATANNAGDAKYQAVTYPDGDDTGVIAQDGAAGQLLIGKVVTLTGAAVPTAGSISLKLSEAAGKEVKLRWFYFKNTEENCALYKMLVLSSVPEAAG